MICFALTRKGRDAVKREAPSPRAPSQKWGLRETPGRCEAQGVRGEESAEAALICQTGNGYASVQDKQPRLSAALRRHVKTNQGQHDDAGAYAYAVDDVIHWGFNGGPKGFCIARGVVPR